MMVKLCSIGELTAVTHAPWHTFERMHMQVGVWKFRPLSMTSDHTSHREAGQATSDIGTQFSGSCKLVHHVGLALAAVLRITMTIAQPLGLL